MLGTATLRRVSGFLIAASGVIVFVAGCSSSSVGKPVNASVAATTGESSQPAASGVPSISGLPSSLPVTLPSSLPAIGGSKDPFCKELTNGDLANLGAAAGNAGNISSVVTVWDKLTAAAPDAIKADAKSIDDFLHSVQSGSPDASKAAAIGVAAQHIETWITSHCI